MSTEAPTDVVTASDEFAVYEADANDSYRKEIWRGTVSDLSCVRDGDTINRDQASDIYGVVTDLIGGARPTEPIPVEGFMIVF